MNTRLFTPQKQTLPVDIVLLLTRLAIGYVFVVIGWGKIQNPTAWMQGVSFAPLWQVLAAVAEFGGGLALVLGLFTRLGSLGIAITMMVATVVHIASFGHPYVNLTGGPSYQVAVAYLLIALLVFVLGPGRFSLDHVLFKRMGKQKDQKDQNSEGSLIALA